MASVDVRIGYDGKCGVHRTFPTIFRRTEQDMILRVPDDMEHSRVVNIIKVTCAKGHTYLAIDLDEAIPDPFDEASTDSIVAEEF